MGKAKSSSVLDLSCGVDNFKQPHFEGNRHRASTVSMDIYPSMRASLQKATVGLKDPEQKITEVSCEHEHRLYNQSIVFIEY